jgi:glycosyltransferase involved in cell wall biosynthesis
VLTSRFGVGDSPPEEEGVTRSLYLQADVNHYRPLEFFLRRPRRERANQRALRSALDDFQPDIVFIWGMWNLSPRVAHWAEQWLPGRVAYAVAGYWPMEPGVHEAYWRTPARSTWGEALKKPARWLALRALVRQRQAYPLELEHVSCVSQYVRRKLTEAGVLPHGARVIYNGIDPQPFLQAAATSAERHNGMRLVYAGGLVSHKGVHTAIEALGWLRQRDQARGLHLSIVGGGHPTYESRLERRVEELELNEYVTFRGRVPREEVAGILADHDAFLFTSVYEEPIARAVMEAMAAGLAVIGTPVGGQREMLEDGENALVFPPEDAPALAQCILRLRDDPDTRMQLAEAGRRTVLERFTLERMVDEMETWLEEIAR